MEKKKNQKDQRVEKDIRGINNEKRRSRKELQWLSKDVVKILH